MAREREFEECGLVELELEREGIEAWLMTVGGATLVGTARSTGTTRSAGGAGPVSWRFGVVPNEVEDRGYRGG